MRFKTLRDWWNKVPRQYRLIKHTPPTKDCFNQPRKYTVEYRSRLKLSDSFGTRLYSSHWWPLGFALDPGEAKIMIERDRETQAYAQTVQDEVIQLD